MPIERGGKKRREPERGECKKGGNHNWQTVSSGSHYSHKGIIHRTVIQCTKCGEQKYR